MRRSVVAMVCACVYAGSAFAVSPDVHAYLLGNAVEQVIVKRLPSWEGGVSFACGNEHIVSVPAETQKVALRSVRFDPSGRGIATWYMGFSKGARAMVTATFCLTGTIAAFVAVKDISVGEWLTSESVSVQRIPVDRVELRGNAPASVDGLRALKPIRAGEIVSYVNTQIGRDVERGEKVKARLNEGKITIEAEAVALKAASVGQPTFIRIAQSSMALPAIVTAPGKVQIESTQK